MIKLKIAITLLIIGFFQLAMAENSVREVSHLSVQIGHRNQELISFKSRNLDDLEVFVISYLQNGRTLVERVVPKEFFESQMADFEKTLPQRRRKALFDISSCGQPLTIAHEVNKQTELICLDHASRVDRALISQWWKSLRAHLQFNTSLPEH